jgi:hypothetical protein
MDFARFFVKEMRAVAKYILDNSVACMCFQQRIHLYRLTRNASLLEPVKRFVCVLTDDGLELPDAGD